MPLGYIHALATVNRHKQAFTRQRHKHAFTNSANMWAIIFLYQTGEYNFSEFKNELVRTTEDSGGLHTCVHANQLKVETFVTFILLHLFHLPSNLNSGLGENKFERTTKKWHYYNMTATSRISRNTETTFAHWLISEEEDDFIKLNVSRCHSDCH